MTDTVELHVGALRLQLALGEGVHHDRENEALYRPLAALVRGGERVLDLGCGNGVLGVIAGLAGAGSVTFADVHEPSVILALENARRNGLHSCAGAIGDFLAPLGDATFDLVLCNPPQTGGGAELRRLQPARYGGDDGAEHFVRLAEGAARVAPRPAARIAFFQLSRANPRRARAAFERAGFELQELAAVTRRFTLRDLETLAPGTGVHQLALRRRGEAEFEGPEPDSSSTANPAAVYRMRQALMLATRITPPEIRAN